MGVVGAGTDSGTTDIGDPQIRDILILNRVGVLDLVRSPVHSAELQGIHHCAQAGVVSVIVDCAVAVFGDSGNQRHEAVESDIGFSADKGMHLALGDIKGNGASLALIGKLSTDIVQRAGSPGLYLNGNRVGAAQDGKGIRTRRMNGDVTCAVELVSTLNSAICVEEAAAPAGGEPAVSVTAQADINKGVRGTRGTDANGNACRTYQGGR